MSKKSVFKNTAILGGATGLSQGLVVLASPLLTRLYGPEDFGILAVFGAFIGLLGGFSCMRYEHALPLAKDETEAANLVALCAVILGTTVLITCAALLVFGDHLAGWLNMPALRPYMWLLPVGVFAMGAAEVARFWVVRAKNFKRVAGSGIAASIMVVSLQVGFGAAKTGPTGLILGRLGGIICGAVVLLTVPLRDLRPLVGKISLSNLVQVAKRHNQFPLLFLPSSAINAFGRELPILFLSIFFGPATTGLYALTRRVLTLPTILVGQQVRKVYYAYAADAKRDGDLQHLTKAVFTALVQISLPGMAILAIVAPELFALVFGETWRDAGFYAQWICPWVFMALICSPLTRLPMIFERQGGELVFQIVLLAARALALVVGGVAQDVVLAFALFGTVSFLCWAGFLVWSMRLVEIGLLDVLGVCARELAVAAAVILPLILAKLGFLVPEGDLVLLAVAAGCVTVAAAILVFRSKHHIVELLASK